jgi:hypothetical protein
MLKIYLLMALMGALMTAIRMTTPSKSLPQKAGERLTA